VLLCHHAVEVSRRVVTDNWKHPKKSGYSLAMTTEEPPLRRRSLS